MEPIISFDQSLFHLINGTWNHEILDQSMVYIRNKYFWAPLYLYLVVYLWLNYKYKGLYILVILIISFVLADQLSSSIIKPLVHRLRPCNDPTIADQVRLLISCGPGYSFTSSHATNHFTLASFLSFNLYRSSKLIPFILLVTALAVGYAQIYVGVHYPIDILGGALLGISIGFVMWFLSEKFAKVTS